jgi:hypothetical protein
MERPLLQALPIHVDVRAVALQIEEIRLALSDDLVRERNFSLPRITRLGTVHADIVSRRDGVVLELATYWKRR